MLENISPEWLAAICTALGIGGGYAINTVKTVYKGGRTLKTDRREDAAIDTSNASYRNLIAELQTVVTNRGARIEKLEQELIKCHSDKHGMFSRAAAGGDMRASDSVRVTDILGTSRGGDE